jgi:hypothetical protein
MADPQTDPVAALLQKAPLTKGQRADLWDVFQQSANEDDLAAKLQTLKLPQAVKADLWDLKHQSAAATPHADATKPAFNAPRWTTQYPKTAQVVKGALDALPAIGGMVGGVIGAPAAAAATPLGAIAVEAGAVGLGAGAGRSLRDLATEGLGLEAPSPLSDRVARVALDTTVGGLTQAVLPGAVTAIKTPVKTLGEVIEMLPARLRPDGLTALLKTRGAAGPLLERPAWQTWPEHAVTPTAESPSAPWNPSVAFQDLRQATGAAPASGPRTLNEAFEDWRASIASKGAPAASTADAATAPAARLKLSSTEWTAAMELTRKGLSAEQAVQAVVKMRELPAAFRNLPTDAEVRATVQARNTSGRWKK